MSRLEDLVYTKVGIRIDEELRSLEDPEYNLFKRSLRIIQEIGGSVIIDNRFGDCRLQVVDPNIFKGPTELIEFANVSASSTLIIIDESNRVLASMET